MTDLHHHWKAALIDLDGTLIRGNKAIPGAEAFVERLRERDIQPIFFTNNATRTPVAVVQHLERFGILAYPHEVCTSAQAAANHLKQELGGASTEKHRYVLAVGQEGLLEALRVEGFQPLSVRHPKVSERIDQIIAAVVGLDPQITYAELAVFCRVVARLGAFTLTNGDVRLPTEDGFAPGNGAIGAFVQTASRVVPYIAGKPNPDFVRYALERFQLNADDVVLIGDNLFTDIVSGRDSGIHTIHVASGVQTREDFETTGIYPDEAFESVNDLLR